MTTPPDLLELADRCEKATGPDRGLDRQITEAIYGRDLDMLRAANRGSLAFTESIDTARTLVPFEHAWSVQWSDATKGEAWLYPPDNAADEQFYGRGATVAIALTAASLRAIKQEAGDDRS